jgi:hypothetical protein
MKRSTLVNQLRFSLQLESPQINVDKLTDEEVIDMFNGCPCCDDKCVRGRDIDRTIEEATSAQNWLDIIDKIALKAAEQHFGIRLQ